MILGALLWNVGRVTAVNGAIRIIVLIIPHLGFLDNLPYHCATEMLGLSSSVTITAVFLRQRCFLPITGLRYLIFSWHGGILFPAGIKVNSITQNYHPEPVHFAAETNYSLEAANCNSLFIMQIEIGIRCAKSSDVLLLLPFVSLSSESELKP